MHPLEPAKPLHDAQMCGSFYFYMTHYDDRDLVRVITHPSLYIINNIYRVDELDREATCAKIAQVQTEGKRQVTRTIPYFNLDS